MSIKLKKTGLLAVSILALCHGTALAGNAHIPALPSLVPSNPEAGECYARVKVPARFESRSQNVMVQEGYTEYQVQQPHISSRAQEVMVKEPSTEYRVRQPRYTTVTEQMMIRPAYEKLKVSPPEFHTVTETVQVSGSRLIWKKGNPGQLAAEGYTIHSTADGGPGGHGYSSTTQYGSAQNNATHCGQTCEIWCLVEEPGQSVSFNRKALARPSMVHRIPVEAKYQSITKQMLADPGGVDEIPIPAKYQTVMVEDVMPAHASSTHEVPAVYNDVAVNVAVEDERWEWRRVVCETGTHPGTTSSSYSSGYSSGTPSYSGSTYSTDSYSSGAYSSGTTYGSDSAYTSSSYSSGSTYSGPTHNEYEGVCRGKTQEECYGQDLIDAYNETHAGSSTSFNNGYYDSGSSSSEGDVGYYDQTTGEYETVKRKNKRYRK